MKEPEVRRRSQGEMVMGLGAEKRGFSWRLFVTLKEEDLIHLDLQPPLAILRVSAHPIEGLTHSRNRLDLLR